MDERSFQVLPSVFGSHCIPFQAPAVVNEKVYIPPALVAFFLNVNVSESAHPTLPLNLCSFFKNSPSVTAERAVWLKFLPWVGRNSSVVFSFLLVFHTLAVSQEVCNCPADSSTWLCTSSNIGSFMSSFIYQSWVSPCLSVATSGAKQTHCLSCSLLEQSKLAVFPVHCLHKNLPIQWEAECEHYVNQVLTLILTATLVWHNVGYQLDFPRDTKSKNTLCTHLGALGSVQPP